MFIEQKTKPNTISISHDVRVRNMTGVTSTAATDYPSGAPGYTPVAHSIVSSVVIDIFEGLSFCSVFCLPLHYGFCTFGFIIMVLHIIHSIQWYTFANNPHVLKLTNNVFLTSDSI
jgi:hypothetical protein